MLRKTLVISLGVWVALALAGLGCSDDDDGPVCGDGVCEAGEDADSCPADCGCGNGVRNPGEDCDDADLGTATCTTEGYAGGTLACNSNCSFDYDGCYGGEDCGDGTIQSNEDCDGTDLNDTTCADLTGFDGGTLTCHPDTCLFVTSGCCQDGCTTLNDTRCNAADTAVETCLEQTSGCLDWEVTESCVSPAVCDDTTTPQCVTPCTDECTPANSLRCHGGDVEICEDTDSDGCLEWNLETECTGDASCFDYGHPQCLTQGGGTSCSDVFYLDVLPFNETGDLYADLTDDETFDGTECEDLGTGDPHPDKVWTVYLNSGETLGVREDGMGNSAIRILDTCDANHTCLSDYYYYIDIPICVEYTATADMPVYVAMEGVYSDTDDSYDITIDRVTDANRSHGVWEQFSSEFVNDLDGCVITFTPSATEMEGYVFQTDCSGVSAYPHPVNSLTPIAMDDDESISVELAAGMGSFTFYGQSYIDFYLNSNGSISFKRGNTYSDLEYFLGNPTIGALHADLDPSSGGEIYVEHNAAWTAITYDGVPEYNGANTISAQIVLYPNGTIEIHYLDVQILEDGAVGVTNGSCWGDRPAEVDFAVGPPSYYGQLVITEVMYAPTQVNDSEGEYIEIYNPTQKTFDLDGCELSDNADTHTFSSLVIGPAQYVVLVRNANSAQNGGIAGGYAIPEIAITDGGDILTLECGAATLDVVDFSGGWPAGGDGVSMELRSSALSATGNNFADAWCDGQSTYGAGDTGTPGAPNDDCGATVLLEETFDTGIPGTWTVVDAASDGYEWHWCNESDPSLFCYQYMMNFTGFVNATWSPSQEGFANVIDEDELGNDLPMQNEILLTPTINVPGGTTALYLDFFLAFVPAAGSTGYVEVSTNGTDWVEVDSYNALIQGYQHLDLTTAVGAASSFQIRFRYDDESNWEYVWQIDDVVVWAE